MKCVPSDRPIVLCMPAEHYMVANVNIYEFRVSLHFVRGHLERGKLIQLCMYAT
jgi:hypothetical protein